MLVAAKLFVILFYGPLLQPDSGGYITYADQMLRDSRWLYDQPGGGGDASYRMLGYPALIAAFKLLAGEYFGYGVLLIQAMLSLAATAVLYGFLRDLFDDWRWALFAVSCYAAGLPLVFDAFLLTDGIYGNIVAIIVATLGGLALRCSGSASKIATIGGALACAFLVREATLQLVVAFLPLLALAAREGFWSRTQSLVLFALPLFVVAATYMCWNNYRSNAFFVTTGMRTAALLPLVQVAGRGALIFDGDSRLDQAARSVLVGFSYDEVLLINRRLEVLGMSGAEIDREVREKYWKSLLRFPGEFSQHAFRELGLHKRALVLANPIRSAVHLEEFRAKGELAGLGSRVRRAIAGGHYWLGGIVAIELMFSVISVAIGFLAFVVFPVRFVIVLIRQKRLSRRWLILGALWLLYITFLTAYAMIRVEDRYLIGVLPAILAVGLAMARDVLVRGRVVWAQVWPQRV